jgi:hypothetical protein
VQEVGGGLAGKRVVVISAGEACLMLSVPVPFRWIGVPFLEIGHLCCLHTINIVSDHPSFKCTAMQ